MEKSKKSPAIAKIVTPAGFLEADAVSGAASFGRLRSARMGGVHCRGNNSPPAAAAFCPMALTRSAVGSWGWTGRPNPSLANAGGFPPDRIDRDPVAGSYSNLG